MKLGLARKNCLLLRDEGSIVYPASKFLTDKSSNPHTRELMAQSLRIFYRFCGAHRIEPAQLAVEGRCLSYEQAQQLAGLCFRPLAEIEALSDRKILLLTSSKAGKPPQDMPKAVEPNTASKRLNHIAAYLKFFLEVFLEPNIRSSMRAAMISRFKTGESISALARDFDVSRASVMRIVKPSATGSAAT